MTTRSTFRRGFASTVVFDVAARAISALATVLFVRTLPVESFAYVVLLQTVGQFGGSALGGGIRMRYTREQAERVSRGAVEPSSFAIPLMSTVLVVLAAAAVGLTGATALEVGGSERERATFVALAALFTSGQAAVELAMAHEQAHLRFSRGGVVGALRSCLVLVAAGGAAVGVVRSPEAVGLWLAGGMAIAGAVCALPIAWSTRHARAGVEGRFGFGGESGWLTIYYIVSAGFSYISVFLVAALLDDEALASFGAATRYNSILLGPVPALLAVLRVRTSQYDIVDSPAAQANMLLDWIRKTALPVLVVLVAAAIAAPVAIPLVDNGRYPDSIPVFQLLLIVALCQCVTMPGPNLLMAQRRFPLLALLCAAALGFNAAIGVPAALAWGVVGVTVAAAIVGVAVNLGVAFLAVTNSPCQIAGTAAYRTWRSRK